jgi:peptide/nickel transport system permease protein
VVLLLDSTPPFFTGLLLILIFSVWLRLLPIFGALPTVPGKGLQLWLEVGKRLVLPLVALTLGSLASVYLVARSSLVSELREDYVLLAAAKGLSEAGVRRHGERNAIIPLWTITMLNVGAVFGGVAAVETVFSYPGLGRLIYDAVLARDYPVLQGAFLVIAIAVITTNIVADLFYPMLDPRVRRPAVRTAV